MVNIYFVFADNYSRDNFIGDFLMSILGATTQLVEVKLYYKNIKTKSGIDKLVVLDDKNGEIEFQKQEEFIKQKQSKQEEIKEEDRKIEVLITHWKVMSWGEQNKITRRCEKYTPEGMQDIDYYQFRDLRIKSCLHSWNIKDGKGINVPLTPETIDTLPSTIVFALLSRYDSLTEGSQDEQEKN